MESIQFYLTNNSFVLVTDHVPLQWVHRVKDSNPSSPCPSLVPLTFSFQIVHHKGPFHNSTNYLILSHQRKLRTSLCVCGVVLVLVHVMAYLLPRGDGKMKAACHGCTAGVLRSPLAAVGQLSDVDGHRPLTALWSTGPRDARSSPQACTECQGLFKEDPGKAEEEGGERRLNRAESLGESTHQGLAGF